MDHEPPATWLVRAPYTNVPLSPLTEVISAATHVLLAGAPHTHPDHAPFRPRPLPLAASALPPMRVCPQLPSPASLPDDDEGEREGEVDGDEPDHPGRPDGADDVCGRDHDGPGACPLPPSPRSESYLPSPTYLP